MESAKLQKIPLRQAQWFKYKAMNKVFPSLLLILYSFAMNAQKEDLLVIAHRGASAYLPEHTLPAKALAHGMEADYIEQDLVLSKDGVPVVLHDIYLDEVSDVSDKFPERARKDGRYYAIDFLFSELLQLSVTERRDPKTDEARYPKRFPPGKSSFRLHSLAEEIELIQGLNHSRNKDIGIYPEIKNPGFHREEGKDISKIVLAVLKDYGYVDKEDKCILQCFDPSELKRIRIELKSDLFLTQLLEAPEAFSRLEDISSYADAIGPWYIHLMKMEGNGLQPENKWVDKAHELGLKVHPYTFRADQHPGHQSFEDLLRDAVDRLQVDGLFTDFPDQVKAFLKQ